MFSNSSNLFEATISDQTLGTLVGLTYKENHLLTELNDEARKIAPHLARALTARIRQLTGSYQTLTMSNTEIQLYLQNWFLQLFESRESSCLPLSGPFPRLNQIVLLTGIDVILTYSHEITKYSPNPEEAGEAFHKALAVQIASEQLQSQTDTAQHLYDMMLLD